VESLLSDLLINLSEPEQQKPDHHNINSLVNNLRYKKVLMVLVPENMTGLLILHSSNLWGQIQMIGWQTAAFLEDWNILLC